MKPKSPLADHWGIMGSYKDAQSQWHPLPASTRSAFLKAMNVHETAKPPIENLVQVLRPGQSFPLTAPAELTMESGAKLQITNRVPADLPLGYHALRFSDEGPPTRLIVSPQHCFLPQTTRIWGWSVQLYALRSKHSWGIGDLADLRKFARWSRRKVNADFLLLNPLGAPIPVLPQEPSPYYPSSRIYRNPLYLAVEEVPGALLSTRTLERLAAAGRFLNGKRLIDRDEVFRLKMAALQKLWKQFRGDPAFDRYRLGQGGALRRFAIFCALAQVQGGDWRQWPRQFRTPGAPAVKRFSGQHNDRIAFHEWLQWLLEEQFARAGAVSSLFQDVPVGVNPGGADAWAWQKLLAMDMSIGAPPDEFNSEGQNWGLPPFVPHKLRAAGYEPFRKTIQAALRHAGGLRIDHVMGLFRLFWIPQGAASGDGAYVRYRADELLAILAIESQRAKAIVVGEDLGTVEEGVREELRKHQVLSYRVLWFEPKPDRKSSRQALTTVTTHDLPTIAGLWSGSDVAAQIKLGLRPNRERTERIINSLQARMRTPPDAPLRKVILEIHRLLAQSGSMLLAATLEDALGLEERPNLPGTSNPKSNWSLALPKPLESIQRTSLLLKIARILARDETSLCL